MSVSLAGISVKSILLAAKIGLARDIMVINVVLGAEKAFNLLSLAVELQPLLVGRLTHSMTGDSCRLQPVANSGYRLLCRGEQIVNLLGGVELPVIGRLVVRTELMSVTMSSQPGQKHIHIHEKVVTPIQVGLDQPNSHGQGGPAIHSTSFVPRRGKNIATFVYYMSLAWSRYSQGCRDERAQKKNRRSHLDHTPKKFSHQGRTGIWQVVYGMTMSSDNWELHL